MKSIQREQISIQVDGAGGLATHQDYQWMRLGKQVLKLKGRNHMDCPYQGEGIPDNDFYDRTCRALHVVAKEVKSEVAGIIKGLAPLLNVTWQTVIPAKAVYGLKNATPMHKVLAGIIYYAYCLPVHYLWDPEHCSAIRSHMQCALDHLHGQRKFSLTAPGSAVMSGIGSIIATGLVETVSEAYSHIKAKYAPEDEKDEQLKAIRERKVIALKDAGSLLVAGAVATAIGGPLCGLGTVAGSLLTQIAVRSCSKYIAHKRLEKPVLDDGEKLSRASKLLRGIKGVCSLIPLSINIQIQIGSKPDNPAV